MLSVPPAFAALPPLGVESLAVPLSGLMGLGERVSVVLVATSILALLSVLGMGLSIWLLGPRLRPLWPFVAPVVGLASIVVLGDIPSTFVGADRYAWPLLLGLLMANLGLLKRHRSALHWKEARWLFLPLAVLPLSLLPYLRVGSLTTLSEHNHDWIYYLNLETTLSHAGYGSSWTDTGGLFHDMSAVLRRGGWRAGISIAGSFLGAIFRLRPHEVDGTLWCVLHAVLPSTALASFAMLVPRASKQARGFVFVMMALSGPSLLLLRMSFASHLASLPLFTLLACVTWRGLRERAVHRRALAALLLAASITVLADGAPYLLCLLLALAFAVARQGVTSARQITLRLGWGLVGLALIPASLYRIALSIHSLGVTGYSPPAARFDASLHVLLPTLLGQQAHELDLSAWHHAPFAAVLFGCIAALWLSTSFRRIPSLAVRSALRTPILVSLTLILCCDMMHLSYPAWKLALTTSPFVLFAMAASLDHARHPRSTAAVLAASQFLTLAYTVANAPSPLGVLPMHQALVRSLEAHPGEVYLLGHHGDPSGVLHEHALAYLFEQDGRRLRGISHPSSYLRVSWPRDDFAVRTTDREVLVITTDEDRVLAQDAEVIHRSGVMEEGSRRVEFTVMSLRENTAAASINFSEGFLPREVEPTFAFRWSDAHATLYVDLPTSDSCLSGTMRGTPDGDATAVDAVTHAMAPHAYYGAPERVLARRLVPLQSHWVRRTFARAEGTPQVVMIDFAYLGQRSGERVDTRPIHFALGALELRRGAACEETE